MTPTVNCQVEWWEATQTCANKSDNEFSVGNSEETIRKHLDVPAGVRSETDPPLLSRCHPVPLCAARAERGSRTLGQSLELRFTDCGPREKGRLPRAHTLTHTTRGYKARTSAGAHPEECTYKYVPHLSTPITPQIGACGLTHFFHSCTDITHNRAIRELTHARAHVPLCAHTLTPRAHTLLRTHRPSYTCTHRARTLTPGAHTVLCTHAP